MHIDSSCVISFAGLVICEAAGVSGDFCANGWAQAPGMYTQEHMEGWKKIVDAIHEVGGLVRHTLIFLFMMMMCVLTSFCRLSIKFGTWVSFVSARLVSSCPEYLAGRCSHSYYTEGKQIVAPSAIAAEGLGVRDANGVRMPFEVCEVSVTQTLQH